jgi:hypothetical protein
VIESTSWENFTIRIALGTRRAGAALAMAEHRLPIMHERSLRSTIAKAEAHAGAGACRSLN